MAGGKFEKGDGRVRKPKGAVNRITAELKDMILGSLSDVGGQEYLARQAIENPGPYMTLVGKIIPSEIKAQHTGKIGLKIEIIKFSEDSST